MNLDVTADDSCLDPHVSCVQTSHPAAPLDVNSEQRSVRQSMMSGPHRGDSAHIHYDVWDIGEVHPGVVVQAWLSAIRRRLSRSSSGQPQGAATTARRHRTQLIEQLAQHLRRRRVLINCLGVVQEPRQSERRLSKSGPRLSGQAVGLSRDARLDGAGAEPLSGTGCGNCATTRLARRSRYLC
jgi:hypothetical protein